MSQMATLTKEQEALIKKCTLMGYGYAKFAANVQSQGWCSPKQQKTMENFKLTSRRPYGNHWVCSNEDWDHWIDMGYEGSPGQYDGEGFW